MSLTVNVVDMGGYKLTPVITRILTELGVKFTLVTSSLEVANIEKPGNFNFWTSRKGWWYGEMSTFTDLHESTVVGLLDLLYLSDSAKQIPELKSTFELIESCAEQYEFEGYKPAI